MRDYRPMVILEGSPRGYLNPLLTEYHYSTIYEDKKALVKVMVPGNKNESVGSKR